MDTTQPHDVDATPGRAPDDDASFLTEFGWCVFGLSVILGLPLGRDHVVTQVVRVLATLVLIAALVVSLRSRRWGRAVAAAIGVGAGVLIQVAGT